MSDERCVQDELLASSDPRVIGTYAELYFALMDLCYRVGPLSIATRGTHANWTELRVGGISFNLDNPADQAQIVDWAHRVRNGDTADPVKP